LIALIGKDPFAAIYTIFTGAVGGYYSLGSTLNLTTILVLTGLAGTVAFLAGIWNIGMEGQLYIGALSGAITAFALPGIGVLAVPLAFIIGTLAGGLYAALAGALKAKLKVNEIVSTIMLNYIAVLLVDWVGAGPLHNPGAALNETPPIPTQLAIPSIPGTTIQPGIIIAILLCFGLFYILTRTKFGFELRMTGGNYRAAEYVGVRAVRQTVTTMFISGALSGLAGCFLLFGSSYSVFDGISKSYGYLGIGVALLASLNPIGAIFSAFLFSVLDTGGIVMQAVSGVPFEVAESMAAIIVIVILIRPLLAKAISRKP